MPRFKTLFDRADGAMFVPIKGSRGPDLLQGDDGDNKLVGRRGDDTLSGGAGRDIIVGGPGNDTLNGEDGNDRMVGGAGSDTLTGGAGDDKMTGSSGPDTFAFALDYTAPQAEETVNFPEESLTLPVSEADFLAAYDAWYAGIAQTYAGRTITPNDPEETFDLDGDPATTGDSITYQDDFTIEAVAESAASDDGNDIITDFHVGLDQLLFDAGGAQLTQEQFSNLFALVEGDYDSDGVTDSRLVLASEAADAGDTSLLSFSITLLGVSGETTQSLFDAGSVAFVP